MAQFPIVTSSPEGGRVRRGVTSTTGHESSTVNAVQLPEATIQSETQASGPNWTETGLVTRALNVTDHAAVFRVAVTPREADLNHQTALAHSPTEPVDLGDTGQG